MLRLLAPQNDRRLKLVMALQLDEIHSPSNGSTIPNDFNKSCSELNSAFGNLRGKPCKSNFKTRNDVQFKVTVKVSNLKARFQLLPRLSSASREKHSDQIYCLAKLLTY
ncbi:hypothetical protein LOK49_LG06G01431 [Camellia lanceoleosa]|uniref:Uncharacterized protein n=1 Tax=Camellia lanceoleosa TaxID=1840588 RepID=A0ACC0HEQ5_9ERIC|nr:hypothetical protein LOK49_LG06G01431 [Camellia lanceoleosa]